MSNELAGLLGDKYTPATHDYCLSNRRSSHAKKLEGWFDAGEMVNHGEHIIVLARVKPPEPPKPVPQAKAPAAKPTITQRVVRSFGGSKS